MTLPISTRAPVRGRAMVATSERQAAEAGAAVLRAGGNAVDAAVATAAALTVTEPCSNGIGGDAFAIVWDGARLHGLNASGRSPTAWSPERFAGQRQMPTLGWDCVTVPGAVSAWRTLSERFGALPFADLLRPAIALARDGFTVDPTVAGSWQKAAGSPLGEFADWRDTFLRDGRPPQAGEIWRAPAHAATLAEIGATQGHSFYTGRLAARIATAARQAGAALNAEDLAAHEPRWVEPLALRFGDFVVHELPPNGHGLAALIALGILDWRGIRDRPLDSPESVHLQVEAMKIAFAEAHRHIADPACLQIEPAAFLRPDYLARRAAEIAPDRAGDYGPSPPPEHGTVYLCTADAGGMMVSYIQSNYMGFGSGIVIPGTGIAMQNRGAGFSLEPGHPNQVDGGKLPYHTIIPGFLTTPRGEAVGPFGVMGGHMQPQGHAQVVLRLAAGLDPQAALAGPRWYVAGDNSRVGLEPAYAPSLSEPLRARGHSLYEPTVATFGRGQVILRHAEGGYVGGSEPRCHGAAVVA